MKRAISFLICLLLISVVGAQKPVQKTKPKPPAKPAAKLPADPVVELYERTKKTLTDVLAEVERLNRYHNDNVAGKPTGEWVSGSTSTKEDWVSKSKVPRDVGTGQIEEVSKYLKSNESAFAQYKDKKLSAQDLAYRLYGSLTSAIGDVWMLSSPRYEAAVLSADVDRNRQFRAIEIGNEVMATRPRLNTESEQRAWYGNVGIPRIDAAMDAYLTQLWGESVAQAKELRGRVEKARKRWVSELWKYYGFAEAKTASPTDAHARNKESLRSFINGFETETPPLEFDQRFNNGVTVDLSTIAHHYHTSGGALEPFEHAKFGVEPDLQVFKNATALLSLTKCLQPPVEKLRGYKEEVEPPAITDVHVLPLVNANGISRAGHIAPFDIEGSHAYHLFIYGPKLPTKKSAMKSLQGPAHGVLYEPIAFAEDIRSGAASKQAKALWDTGIDIITGGRAATQVTDIKAMPMMLVRVRLTSGVLPGLHTFKVNGADARWFLHQGTSKASIEIVRRIDPDPEAAAAIGDKVRYEPATTAYRGEPVYVQVRTAVSVELPEIKLVVGKNGAWIGIENEPVVKAALVQGESGLYRTPPLYLLEPNDPRLDPKSTLGKRELGAKYIDIWPGDTFQATFEDPALFVLASGVSRIGVAADPQTSLWYDALSRSARATGTDAKVLNWRTLPAQEALRVRNIMISQVAFRYHLQWLSPLARTMQWVNGVSETQSSRGDVIFENSIKIGDHAAMLLLKDRFVQMMREVQLELARIDTEDKKIAFLDALDPVMDEHPIGKIETDGYVAAKKKISNPSGMIEALRSYYRGTRNVEWERRFPGYIREAKIKGFDKYRESVDKSLERAEAIEDKDIEGLIRLIGSRSPAKQEANERSIGDGFDAVAKDLVPRLMRQKRGPNGAWQWEPDVPARAAVNGLNAALEAVRAQRDYSALDTQVVLAAASCVPMMMAGGTLKTIVSLAVNAASVGQAVYGAIPEIYEKEADYDFALGAQAVLGAERFNMADVQRTPTWGVLLTYFGTIVGAGTTMPEVCQVLSTVTKRVAMPVARVVAGQVKKLGAAAFAKFAKNEQAALFAAAAEADLKLAAQGANALDEAEEEVRAAAKALAEEAENKNPPRGLYPGNPKEELANPAQMVAPREAKVFGDPIPSTKGPWTGGDKKPILLGDQISDGSVFFRVFHRAGLKEVVKVFKLAREDVVGCFRGIKKAKEVLEKFKIPHKKILKIVDTESRAYVIQELLTESFDKGKEAFIVSNWLRKQGALTDDMENAIVALVKKMRDEKVVFEDFKFDNIYLENLGKGPNGKDRWVCGVIDVDRIAQWGDLTDDLNYFATKWEMNPFGNRINSAVGPKLPKSYNPDQWTAKRMIASADEFWQLTLERMYMIDFVPGGGFRSNALNVDKLDKVFPGLKDRGYLEFFKRSYQDVPKPPLLFWLESLFANVWAPRPALRLAMA